MLSFGEKKNWGKEVKLNITARKPDGKSLFEGVSV